ncbi:alpha/beta fold hydrolase [Halococcus saccharolyticus]|uniref:Alpha/beta hydrolase fold protein n=1 Tax=Halococcus saccharolyticus DSM 5350 TaxID=1227455 RepID=M0MJA1_9EURY|nr:alpha/beta hydrolase [Halococcus saccharolyticus]EMA45787.1 alpha/beta hydrolase fold protein [Halococcus saccharolyticus DSM 5350]
MPTVQTNEIQMYYEEYGEGPPIVFLHGATADHRLWAEQAKPLASDYRVIVYDLRGHGRTGGSERASYTMGLYADDLGALISGLDLDRPVICGLSMGGMIAQRYAAESPSTIAALCTIGTMTPEILSRSEWVERRLFPTVAEFLSPAVDPDRVMSMMFQFHEWWFDEEGLGDLEKAERIKNDHAADVPEVLDEELEKIDDVITSYPSDSIDHASITVPSLLLYGELERAMQARHAAYMADVIPVAETRQIPNAGHNSHVDNPEFIRDSLHEFLSIAASDRYGTERSSP